MAWLSRILIWCITIMIMYGIIVHSRPLIGYNPTSKIDYKTPYSYPGSKGNNRRLDAALQDLVSSQLSSKANIGDVEQKTLDVLKIHPLSSDAIQALASINFLQNREITPKSASLVSEALIRDGRNRRSLKLLMYNSLIKDDVSVALNYIQDILVLNPERTESYVPIVVSLYEVPQYREIILNELTEVPFWSNGFLQKVVPKLDEKDFLSWTPALKAYLKANENLPYSEYISRLYAVQLFSFGYYDEAHSFMKSVFPNEPISSSNLIYNSRFEQRENPPLYNWELSSGSKFLAEYETGGGVFISFNDDKRARILQQYSMVTRGEALKIAFDYDFLANDNKGYFEWEFSCIATRDVFFTYRFDEASADQKGEYIPIPERPEGCEHIYVSLWGVSGLYARRFSMYLTGLRVSKE